MPQRTGVFYPAQPRKLTKLASACFWNKEDSQKQSAPHVQRFAFREFSHDPELSFDGFQNRLGTNVFGSESSADAVRDLLELQRIWSYESGWYWPSPLLDPEFFRHRSQRLKWPAQKLAEYDRNLDRLKEIAARYHDATKPGEHEMGRLAEMIVRRWGKTAPLGESLSK